MIVASANITIAANSRFGSAMTSSAHRYGTSVHAPRRSGSCQGMKRAASIPGTHALNAVNAARNEPAKRPPRNANFPTDVVKRISSNLCSRSRTIAFAQNAASTKSDSSESIPTDCAMLYGESTCTLSGPKPVDVSTKPNAKKSTTAAANEICRV